MNPNKTTLSKQQSIQGLDNDYAGDGGMGGDGMQVLEDDNHQTNPSIISRTRRGHKKSKRQHNLEGLLEKELRQKEAMDTPPSRHYRKRRRRELTPEEIE